MHIKDQEHGSTSARRPKKAQRLAEALRGWIVAGKLVPGDRLPHEKELIKQLASSRGTVREALKILESQGLVTISAGATGGTHVASITYESANAHLKSFFYFQNLSWSQVYDMREQIEPLAVELAVPYLTDTDFTDLEEALTDPHNCCGDKEPDDIRLKESRFHRIIAARCPNPLLRFSLLFVLDMLSDFVRYRNILGENTYAFTSECAMSHALLLKTLRQRDGRKCAELMLEHIRELKKLLHGMERPVEPAFLLAPATAE